MVGDETDDESMERGEREKRIVLKKQHPAHEHERGPQKRDAPGERVQDGMQPVSTPSPQRPSIEIGVVGVPTSVPLRDHTPWMGQEESLVRAQAVTTHPISTVPIGVEQYFLVFELLRRPMIGGRHDQVVFGEIVSFLKQRAQLLVRNDALEENVGERELPSPGSLHRPAVKEKCYCDHTGHDHALTPRLKHQEIEHGKHGQEVHVGISREREQNRRDDHEP